MTVSYTPSNGPNRSKEILDEIVELLCVDDPAKVELIHDQVRQAKKDYEKRSPETDILISDARKEIRGLLKKLEKFGAARYYGGYATFNEFDNAPEKRARDLRFRELCDELIKELQYRLDNWRVPTGRTKTREYAEGSPKNYLATKAVCLMIQYLPDKLSQTEGGRTTKIAERLYEFATGDVGDEPGVGMQGHVRVAVRQYREMKKKIRQPDSVTSLPSF